MALLPKINNQALFTIVSDIVIAVIIVGSLVSSQRMQRQFSGNVLQNSPAQELEVSSLFNNFLIINLFTILASSVTFVYLIIKNTRQLEETNKKLKSVDKLKDEFLSLASHQLKTPASGVKAFLSMLLDGDAGKLTKTQSEFVKEAYDANEREARIIEDLLNVSRIESGRMILNTSEVEVNQLVEEIANEFRKIITDSKLTFSIDKSSESLMVAGDEDKLKMVFGNLIDNARKYTNEGGKVSINVEKVNGKAQVTIEDTGIGIAKADIDKLFQKYFRIDSSRSRQVGGTGLGLYVVKKIIELHQGQIEVKSEVGKGTQFIILLPLKS